MKEREPVKRPKDYENILRNPPDREREARDVLGEALRRDSFGEIRPLWSDLQDAGIKNNWRRRADFIIARLAEAGYRIVKEKEDGSNHPK